MREGYPEKPDKPTIESTVDEVVDTAVTAADVLIGGPGLLGPIAGVFGEVVGVVKERRREGFKD